MYWISFSQDTVISDSNCSLKTKKIVDSCPTDDREKDKFAEKKQCERYARENNCTADPSEFQYHCVINTHRNATIEVCALKKIINGKPVLISKIKINWYVILDTDK